MPNDHTTAIVPLQCWAYESPLLRRARTTIDIGLLAEALIYYDRVLLIPVSEVPVAKVLDKSATSNGPTRPFDMSWRLSFIALIEWFYHRGIYDDLVSMFSDGTLGIYHYAFYTMPVLHDGTYSCWNMQDADEKAGSDTFVKRCLGGRDLERVVPRARHRAQLYRAIDGHIAEVHADQFSRAVENARLDFVDAGASAVALQSFLDDVKMLLPKDMQRDVKVMATDDGRGHTRLTFNLNFGAIAEALAPLEFGIPTPLCGLAHSNRLVWSAAISNCDLYLPTPVSRLVNAKLVESSRAQTNARHLIETLEAKIDFPDIRNLINDELLEFGDVLKIRRRSGRFREWLQAQAGRDREALIAYHHEVARATGFNRAAGKTIKIFGALAGAGVGAAVAGSTGAAYGAIVGNIAGKVLEDGVKFIFDVAGRLDGDWKPVVFGDWMRDYVSKATGA
jgi:hypothetical protein